MQMFRPSSGLAASKGGRTFRRATGGQETAVTLALELLCTVGRNYRNTILPGSAQLGRNYP